MENTTQIYRKYPTTCYENKVTSRVFIVHTFITSLEQNQHRENVSDDKAIVIPKKRVRLRKIDLSRFNK